MDVPLVLTSPVPTPVIGGWKVPLSGKDRALALPHRNIRQLT